MTRRPRGAGMVRAIGLAAVACFALGVQAPRASAVGPEDPGVLTVQTVPVIPGARVSADGRIAEADKAGVARLPVRRFTGLEERFNAPETRVSKTRRAVLDRVRGQLHNAFNGKVIEVGLRTERLIKWRFVDRTGLAILPDRLTRLVLKSSTGEVVTLEGPDIDKPRWLAASRTQQTSFGLMSKDIYWTVQSVVLNGAELVNRSQQRFVPDVDQEWTIELLFFEAKVQATDLLFGTPAGEGVEVTGPDGTSQRYPLGDDGVVTLPAVPRGEYQMTVFGPGISFSRPVSVSKDQDVDLMVISVLDIALVATMLLLIAVSLILIGRRRRISAWSVRRRAGPPAGGEHVRDSRSLGVSVSAMLVGTALALGPSVWSMPIGHAMETPAHAALGAPATELRSEATEQPIPVLAYYYIWFNPTSWKRAKVDYPLLGRYSSDDSVIMAEHVRMAKEAGIDGFLVSWKRTPQLNKRLEALTEVASAAGFKLGIVYQGLDFKREPLPIQQVAEDLAWFADTYSRHHTYRVFDGKPVVIWTGTERFSEADIARATMPVANRVHVLSSAKSVADYERVASRVDGNAYYWSSVKPDMPGYAEKLQAMSQAVHAHHGLWIAPFAPGFDARLVGGSSTVPRNGGETLRRELAVAQGSSPDALGLISWNEFSENTHVEPSEEQGTTALHTLALALGATPPVAPQDSSDELTTSAGVTGWGALVLLGILIGVLNIFVIWRGRRAPALPTGSDADWSERS